MVRISIESYDALGPLSIADIADRGVTLAVRRWRTLLVLVLLEAIPEALQHAALPMRGPGLWGPIVVDVLLVALLYPAAILTATAPNAPAPGAMLHAAARRYGASLVASLISFAFVALWVFVSVIAGLLGAAPFAAFEYRLGIAIAAAVAGGGAALLLVPRAGLVAAIMLPIVILERCSAGEALTRARRRVNHAGFLRSSLLGLALFAVTVAPVFVVSSAADALTDVTHLAALRALGDFIADAVSLGLGAVLCTVAALDLRARYEGTDLTAELDAAVK